MATINFDVSGFMKTLDDNRHAAQLSAVEAKRLEVRRAVEPRRIEFQVKDGKTVVTANSCYVPVHVNTAGLEVMALAGKDVTLHLPVKVTEQGELVLPDLKPGDLCNAIARTVEAHQAKDGTIGITVSGYWVNRTGRKVGDSWIGFSGMTARVFDGWTKFKATGDFVSPIA